MARTIVYPRASTHSRGAPPVEITFGGPSLAAQTETPDVAPDHYTDKIAKYVPAEILAFFAPMAAVMSDRPNLLVAAAIVGLLATPGYLWNSARGLSPAQQPLPHFYVLAAVSFTTWAIGTTRLGQLMGLDQIASSFILGTTVFLLPLVDSLLAGKTAGA